MKEITFFDTPSFKQTITLDNKDFILLIYWNSRGEHYTLSVYDINENLLVAGIRLVLNIELFGNYPDRGLPQGNLFVSNLTSEIRPINQDDFTNGRLKLIYIENK